MVEGTAGNTGIGLAHICRAKGYKCVIYMPNTQSQEKIDLLRILGLPSSHFLFLWVSFLFFFFLFHFSFFASPSTPGADVRPVPAVAFTDPANYNHQAKAFAQSIPNAVWTNQFDNVANMQAHVETTGPEIWTQTEGKLDGFTCSTGTGGTLSGTATFLKKVHPKVKVFLADPPGSVLYNYLKAGKLEREGTGSITEGIGQGRVTENLKTALPLFDDALHITDERTIEMVFRLLDEEGLFVGASSALNVVAAYDMAKKLGPGHTVATIISDGAYRYQSRLFSKKWLESKGLLTAVPARLHHYISLP